MNATPHTEWQENVTFDELFIGQSKRLFRTLSLDDIKAFAAVSGDTNPAHLDPEYANDTLMRGVVAHGMWGASLISALLGTKFPGPGTIYVDQMLHFVRPVRIGDTLTVVATVISKEERNKHVKLDCQVCNQRGEAVLHGVAEVLAPTEKVRLEKITAPQIQLFDPEARFKTLLAMGAGMAPARCAVVHPCDESSLSGAMDAARHGLIVPVLIGPRGRIEKLAQQGGLDLGGAELHDVPHSHAAADLGADMAAKGNVEMLMKGSLHTDELLHAVLARPELRTGRRMSHVFRFDVPMYDKPLLITDAALNIQPTLADKVYIVQNAIDFCQILGVNTPKVAILSAVETVNSSIPSTLDASALCKMADRGQIVGAMLDGPLAFDNAISARAAEVKHIRSNVAGDADILVVPDLESGNMLAKQLEYFAGATGAGIVLGARVPVALTSRADGPMSRVSSALLALLVVQKNRAERLR